MAQYKVVYHTWSFGVAFATLNYRVSGVVVALEQNKDCTYDAVKFEGRLAGLGYGLPVSFTENNSEIFDDHISGLSDETRVEGRAAMFMGTNTIGNASGGYYRFGQLEGGNKNVAGVNLKVEIRM